MATPLEPPTGWHESSSVTALRQLLDSGAQMSRAIARAAGVSDLEMRTLQHLVEEPLGPAELAPRLSVSSAAVTGIIDRLESRGHVRRRPHRQDRRRIALEVTASGRAQIRARLLPMFAALAELDASFTESERSVVTRYLLGAAAALDRSTATASSPGR